MLRVLRFVGFLGFSLGFCDLKFTKPSTLDPKPYKALLRNPIKPGYSDSLISRTRAPGRLLLLSFSCIRNAPVVRVWGFRVRRVGFRAQFRVGWNRDDDVSVLADRGRSPY